MTISLQLFVQNGEFAPLVKSAAEFMGGTKIMQDFYFLTPGLSNAVCNISACFTLFGHQVVL